MGGITNFFGGGGNGFASPFGGGMDFGFGGGGGGGCCAAHRLGGGASPADPLGLMGGLSPMAGINPMGGMINQTLMMQEAQLMQWIVGMLMGLMLGSAGGAGGAGGGGLFGGMGGGLDGGFGGGGGGGGVGPPISTGPVTPGTEGMLDKARGMLGMTEGGNTQQIMSITGKSGINPASTPWCAAFAINLMKDHGVLDTTGLKNPNYCPEIHRWAQEKGKFGARGQYTPKPGDAILFDWGGDGTDDHIGIVEKVEGGKVYTIEGNSSDAVKRNVYDLGSTKIAGYVISGK